MLFTDTSSPEKEEVAKVKVITETLIKWRKNSEKRSFSRKMTWQAAKNLIALFQHEISGKK